VAAAAVVKVWAAAKKLYAGRAAESAADAAAAAAEFLAGLVDAVREELGLPALDATATTAEFAAELKKLGGGGT